MGMSGMPAAKIRAGKTKVFKEKYFGFKEFLGFKFYTVKRF